MVWVLPARAAASLFATEVPSPADPGSRFDQMTRVQTMKNVGKILMALMAMALPLLAGCNSLHKSIGKGDLVAAERFLQKGVAVDARDPYGRTPLMWATSEPSLVRYLVDRGADVNAKDNNGETPLMKAAFLGRLDVIKYLVEHGADVEARSAGGATVLIWASGDLDVVKYLVEKGADVNARDRAGETPLKRAATLGRLGVVRYLVENGADVHARNSRGETPLELATIFGHADVVKYLQKQGAATNAGNVENPRPPMNADGGRLHGAKWLEARVVPE